MIIYAVSKGYLKDVPLEKVADWEAAFHPYMDANHADLVREIFDTSVTQRKKLSDDQLKKLDAAITEFQKTAPR
jgi:F-type H+-transporting ATPase subunit alpha